MMRCQRILSMALAVCLLSTTISALQALAASPSPEPVQQAEISVGIDTGDVRGGDHRGLQAAVDYIAELGGGTVHVGPGRYQMRNALQLRELIQQPVIGCNEFGQASHAVQRFHLTELRDDDGGSRGFELSPP